jgi:hypothetical protein
VRAISAPARRPAHLNLDPFSALAHGLLNGALHGAAISNTAHKLVCNIAGNQIASVSGLESSLISRSTFLPTSSVKPWRNLLDAFAFAANQDARLGGVNATLIFPGVPHQCGRHQPCDLSLHQAVVCENTFSLAAAPPLESLPPIADGNILLDC